MLKRNTFTHSRYKNVITTGNCTLANNIISHYYMIKFLMATFFFLQNIRSTDKNSCFMFSSCRLMGLID
jgi:hypothetical protein